MTGLLLASTAAAVASQAGLPVSAAAGLAHACVQVAAGGQARALCLGDGVAGRRPARVLHLPLLAGRLAGDLVPATGVGVGDDGWQREQRLSSPVVEGVGGQWLAVAVSVKTAASGVCSAVERFLWVAQFGRGQANGGATCPLSSSSLPFCRVPAAARCTQFGRGLTGGRAACPWVPVRASHRCERVRERLYMV